jgi:hypothetical protein
MAQKGFDNNLGFWVVVVFCYASPGAVCPVEWSCRRVPFAPYLCLIWCRLHQNLVQHLTERRVCPIFICFDGDFDGVLTSVEMSKHFDMAQKGFDDSLV